MTTSTRYPRRLSILPIGLLIGVAACAPFSETPMSISSSTNDGLPPTSGVFDYQLGGTYDQVIVDNTLTNIDVVVRDATAEPLSGAYNVCYVNGFQTQPDDAGFWLERDHLLLKDGSGNPLVDPEWPDEYILDPSTSSQRDEILGVLGPIVTGCADDGFDAVEIDNLDTWTRFESIDESAAHALARAYVTIAHQSGLAIGQKNAAEITHIAHDQLGFDFAIAEECAAYDECATYTDVYGDHVLQIEYPDSLDEAGMTFENACATPGRAPLMILRDGELVPSDDDDHLYDAC